MDVTSRIQQIQSQLVSLSPSAVSTSGAAFGDMLDAASSTSSSVSGQTSGDQVVADARTYLGIPYVWGGTDPAKGLDCSGLVQRVYRDMGYELPRVSYQQATVGTAVPSLAQAQPGDLLAFGSPVHHIAIYIGNNQMIEAPHPGANVRVADVSETPSAIRRVIGSVTPTSGATSASAVGNTSGGPVPDTVPYARLFNSTGAKYGVSPTLLAAVAKQESGYRPDAVSAAGARGMMQLMPGTAKGLGVTDPFNPNQAVDGAARMLRDLQTRFGNTSLALAAYNAGPGAVMKYDGIPPYSETQSYVRNVLAIQGAM